MAKFNSKQAKVKEDGTLEDVSGNTIKVGDKGYYLFKARVEKGGVFTRKVRTSADYEKELAKRTPLSFRWFKALLGKKNLSIDRNGYKAVIESIVAGTFNISKVYEVLVKYKKKTVNATVVNVADGKETDFTKAILEREARKEANEKARAEKKAQKIAEKRAKLEKSIAEKQAKIQKMIAVEEAKVEAMKKSL